MIYMGFLSEDNDLDWMRKWLMASRAIEEIAPPIVADELNKMDLAYRALRKSINGDDVKFEYKLHNPRYDAGTITIRGQNVIVVNPEWFSRAIELSSVWDAAPCLDGAVEISFSFYGITEKGV